MKKGRVARLLFGILVGVPKPDFMLNCEHKFQAVAQHRILVNHIIDNVELKRTLDEYELASGKRLYSLLRPLNEKSRVIEGGAGLGDALAQIYLNFFRDQTEGEIPDLTGFSLQNPGLLIKSAMRGSKKLHFVAGEYIENHFKDLQPFDLYLDFVGAGTYVADVSGFYNGLFALQKPDGVLLIVRPAATEDVVLVGHERVPFSLWLKRFSNLDVQIGHGVLQRVNPVPSLVMEIRQRKPGTVLPPMIITGYRNGTITSRILRPL